jgi:hypothetical protein
MNDKQTAQSTQPIYYDDGEFIHACESSEVLPGGRMVWTKCYVDVPDDQGFTVESEAPAITCPECLKAVAQGQT